MKNIQVVVPHEGDEFWCEREVDESVKVSDVSSESEDDAWDIGAEMIEEIASALNSEIVGNEFQIEPVEVDLDDEETIVGWIVEAYIKESDQPMYDYE